jgi:hypothetical protein
MDKNIDKDMDIEKAICRRGHEQRHGREYETKKEMFIKRAVVL